MSFHIATQTFHTSLLFPVYFVLYGYHAGIYFVSFGTFWAASLVAGSFVMEHSDPTRLPDTEVGIVVFILAALILGWRRGRSWGTHARLPYRLSVDIQCRQSIYDTGKLFFDEITFGRYLFIIHCVISGIYAFWSFFNTIVASPDGR